MKRAIVTVGVSPVRRFGPYLERLKRTFREHGHADYLKIWHREYPPGAPAHKEVHYGFKVHALWDLFEKGYDMLLWLDASCNALRTIEPLWKRIERDGHALINDANPLGVFSSDRALKQFNITRDQAMDIHLMCGACFGFDMTRVRNRVFLERLRGYARPENFNGNHVSRLQGLPEAPVDTNKSKDPRFQEHRADEVYMALLARELGMLTYDANIDFIGGEPDNGIGCIRSGYDLPPAPEWCSWFDVEADK